MAAEEVMEMIRRMTEAVDAAWHAALRTGTPAGLVMAPNEASLGLHRAWIVLADSTKTSWATV